MTYRGLYDIGIAQLTAASVPDAAWDARLLLEEVCQTTRSDLLVHPDRDVSFEEEKRYRDMLKKRADRVPLQQITGKQEFMGLTFAVTPDVLIPRQDTEFVVEEILPHVHDGMALLDMCTGSGCMMISLLAYTNDCMGVAVDVSKKALAVAEENARTLLEPRGYEVFVKNDTSVMGSSGQKTLTLLQSDLFENLPKTLPTGTKFDILFSNPPYIPSGVIATLEPEVKDHEPVLALDGKEDGLYFYRKILQEAGRYLNRGGKVFFEIGHDQGAALRALMEDKGYQDIEIKKDYAGHDRVAIGTYVEA